jgi:hypothetical protein
MLHQERRATVRRSHHPSDDFINRSGRLSFDVLA